jgi:siderophore synthetase component
MTAPLLRQAGDAMEIANDPALFLAEIAPWLTADETRLSQFAAELLATQIKDAQTLHARGDKILRGADYDTVEARLTDSHPYHPSYKSRLGFTLDDNSAYAPEMTSAVTPLLLAGRRDRSRWSVSATIDREHAARTLLGDTDWQRFRDKLSQCGVRPEDYLPLPVHPWQWEEVIFPAFHQSLGRGELVLIGPLTQRYLPQQSIRTLGNLDDRNGLSLKLAMNLVNTSTSRVLAPHTVQNASVISDGASGAVARSNRRELHFAGTSARPIRGIGMHLA